MIQYYIISIMGGFNLLFSITLVLCAITLFFYLATEGFDFEDVDMRTVKILSTLIVISIFFICAIPNYDMRLTMMKDSLPKEQISLIEIIDEKIAERKYNRELEREKGRLKNESKD